MPLYKIINFNPTTKILVWKITEMLEDLSHGILLSDKSLTRLAGMKSEMHQRGFLSVRKLLECEGYSDLDLYYDEFGKPHLTDGKHISISHSHECSTIIISNRITGIDLELRRDKIKIIADKFVEDDFLLDKESADYVSKLTVNWGVKEAVFKIRNEPGISFKNHIKVAPFDISDRQTTAKLQFAEVNQDFNIYFEEIDDYTMVYAFEK